MKLTDAWLKDEGFNLWLAPPGSPTTLRCIPGADIADCCRQIVQLARRLDFIDIDNEGITGSMQGMAASILVHCWAHGDELDKART